MTYYIAELNREHRFICMSEDLHYRWFDSISDINTSLLTNKSYNYTKVENWLTDMSSHGMHIIYEFDENSNPEMFI